MAAPAPDRQRTLRRRHLHERQAVVFGSLVAMLAVVGLGSAAVYTGVMSAPFLDREFSSPPPEETGAALPPAPCPAEGTLPLPYGSVQVTVLNASGRTGLAGATATGLTTRGFVVLTTGNYPTSLSGTAQITFGEAGIAAAYTLAAQLDRPVLVLDTRVDATVDLVLGDTYADLLDPAAVVLDPAAPLVGVTGCVPLEEARASAVPGPTPSATEEAPQDGGDPATEEPVAPPAEG